MAGKTTVSPPGKTTPTTYYSGRPKTESYRTPPMVKVRQPGGKSARVVKSPPRGCGSY